MRRTRSPMSRWTKDPAVLTNIAADDHDALHIGQRVRVRFVPSESGAPYPMFAPE